jgi:hypothetical protein
MAIVTSDNRLPLKLGFALLSDLDDDDEMSTDALGVAIAIFELAPL